MWSNIDAGHAIDIKTRMRKSAVQAVVDFVPPNGTIKKYKFHYHSITIIVK